MEVEWGEEARRGSQASISLLASSPNLVPPSLLAYFFSLLFRSQKLPPSNAPYIPPLVKLLIPTTFCIPLFRFSFRCDTSIYLCISSCFVTSLSARIFVPRFFFLPFFSFLLLRISLFAIQSIILKHPHDLIDTD